MRLLVCDRCRAETDYHWISDGNGLLNPILWLARGLIRPGQPSRDGAEKIAYDGTKQDLDLCESCLSELETWLATKPAKAAR